MWLRKEQGGTSIGPYSWPEDGSVCEIDQATGAALLAIPDGGFTEVGEPEPEGPAGGEVPDSGEGDADTADGPDGDDGKQEPPAPETEGDGSGGHGEEKPASKPAARGRKPAGTQKA